MHTITISFDDKIYAKLQRRAKATGHSTVGKYICSLVKIDTDKAFKISVALQEKHQKANLEAAQKHMETKKNQNVKSNHKRC